MAQQANQQVSGDFYDNLVKVIAMRRGIKPEEAQLWVEAFKNQPHELGQMENLMAMMGTYGPVFDKVSEPMRTNLYGLMTANAMNLPNMRSQSNANDDVVTRIAIMKAALKDESNTTLDAKLSALDQKIEQIKNHEEKAEFKTFRDEIVQQIKAVQDRMTTLDLTGQSKSQTAPTAEQVVNEFQKVENIKQNLLKTMGIQQGVQSGQVTIEDAKKQLETLGYRVQGPMTTQEFEQRMAQTVQQMEAKYQLQLEEVKKQAKEEAMHDEQRLQMLLGLGTQALDVFSSLLGPGEGASAFSKLKTLIKGGATAAKAATGNVAGAVAGAQP